MSDIEAAARAIVERGLLRDPRDSRPCPYCWHIIPKHSSSCPWMALIAALAHATRGEPVAWCVYDAMNRMCGGPYLDHGVADTFASRTPWPKEGPFTVVPLYARPTPPPATGEGFSGLPVAYQSSSIGAPPWDGPATGEADPDPRGEDREAVEAAQSEDVVAARQAFYEAARKWAEASKRDIECGAPVPSQERRDARMNTVACHMDALDAYDALLNAEAIRALRTAERGEGA